MKDTNLVTSSIIKPFKVCCCDEAYRDQMTNTANNIAKNKLERAKLMLSDYTTLPHFYITEELSEVLNLKSKNMLLLTSLEDDLNALSEKFRALEYFHYFAKTSNFIICKLARSKKTDINKIIKSLKKRKPSL